MWNDYLTRLSKNYVIIYKIFLNTLLANGTFSCSFLLEIPFSICIFSLLKYIGIGSLIFLFASMAQWDLFPLTIIFNSLPASLTGRCIDLSVISEKGEGFFFVHGMCYYFFLICSLAIFFTIVSSWNLQDKFFKYLFQHWMQVYWFIRCQTSEGSRFLNLNLNFSLTFVIFMIFWNALSVLWICLMLVFLLALSPSSPPALCIPFRQPYESLDGKLFVSSRAQLIDCRNLNLIRCRGCEDWHFWINLRRWCYIRLSCAKVVIFSHVLFLETWSS